MVEKNGASTIQGLMTQQETTEYITPDGMLQIFAKG